MLRVIDSHTEGEPTRVVLEGGPDLGNGPLSERRAIFARDHDRFRRRVILEPRGHEALVGALLCEPQDKTCTAGVIFFNNEGYLGMCGHGTIGLAVTLAHLGRIAPGRHRIETPVGIVTVDLASATEAEIENVPSYHHAASVTVDVLGHGAVKGIWPGALSWFFLCKSSPFDISEGHLADLTAYASAIQKALKAQHITGALGQEIDHIEIFGSPLSGGDSRSFVLCPGGASTARPVAQAPAPSSPASPPMAFCTRAALNLDPGGRFTGGRFTASYRRDSHGQIIATIRGRAFVVKDATLLLHPDDPYTDGFRTM